MIPAFVQIPVLSIPTLAMNAPLPAAAQSVDFGALLLAQPAMQEAELNVDAPPAKLPEAVAAPAVPTVDNLISPLEASLTALHVPVQKEAVPPKSVKLADVEVADVSVIEPPAKAPDPAVQPPVPAHVPPIAMPIAAAQVQAKPPADERIKIAVAVEAKPLLAVDAPAPAERAAPVLPAPFAEVAAVLAKPAPADPVAQVSERVLDVARGAAWLDQLAGDIIAAQDDSRDLSFRLIPPQLGQLDVRIERLEAGLQLDFAAQTEEAAQIVAAAQPRLIEELRGQGVRVAGSEVATSSGQNSNGGQPQRQPQQPETLHRNFKQPERTAKSGRFA